MLSKNNSKRVIQKTSETIGDFIGIKTADKITKLLLQNNTEKITNESDKKKMHKERYISRKESQEIVANLRLI